MSLCMQKNLVIHVRFERIPFPTEFETGIRSLAHPPGFVSRVLKIQMGMAFINANLHGHRFPYLCCRPIRSLIIAYMQSSCQLN